MSSYFDNYKARVLGGANNLRNKRVNDIKRDFNRYLNWSPTSHEIKYTKVDGLPILDEMSTMTAAITDIASNDKTALDEKILVCRIEEDIDVGCYVYWDDTWYVLAYEEHKSIPSHKKFTLRRCNHMLHLEYKGVIYDMPVSILNLTMYSAGLNEMKYMSELNGKRNIFVGGNPITRSIPIGSRIMVTQDMVYRIAHINDFEYPRRKDMTPGLIKWLVSQTVLLNEDDVENDVAYNKFRDPDSNGNSRINGDTFIFLGETNEYSIDYSGDVEFMLDATYTDIVLVDNGNNTCEVTKQIDFDDIGNSFMLIAKDKSTGDTIDMINIVVRGI